jgi:hypothetical protein
MTWGGRAVSLFPVVWFFSALAAVYHLCTEPDPLGWVLVIFSIYGLPLLCYRLHILFFPLIDGTYDLSERKYSPWWASHMFQFPFITLPFLESVFHFFPGGFSLWLRLWGAKIGSQVHWTPRVEIVDRGHLEVGRGTIFGHLTGVCAHMVVTNEGRPFLVLKRIRIGEACLLGAASHYGPGSDIPSGTQTRAKSTHLGVKATL